jgi:hypothetical protein
MLKSDTLLDITALSDPSAMNDEPCRHSPYLGTTVLFQLTQVHALDGAGCVELLHNLVEASIIDLFRYP